MVTCPIIRAAVSDDGAAIATVIREASSPLMRRTTILGGVGIDRFVHDQIASDSANRFLVAEIDGQVVGMSAWRCEGEELFLNHLFVHPSTQGRRVGTALWAQGLSMMANAWTRSLSLDVYEENERAAAWYRSSGMEEVARRVLMAVPIPFGQPTAQVAWSSTYLGEMDEVYGRYGFSQFTLSTPHTTYTIGRLGPDYFRSPAALLDDEAALAALRRLDPHRRVLCIDGQESWVAASERGAVLLGRTVRLKAPIELVVARLGRVLAASGSESVEDVPS